MDFTFQVHSETIMSHPEARLVYRYPAMSATHIIPERFRIQKMIPSKYSKTTFAGNLKWVEMGETKAPLIEVKEPANVAKPGMEPKDGKFIQNEDGSWSVREELPEWFPEEAHGWLIRLVAPSGGILHCGVMKLTDSLMKQAADIVGIPHKKVSTDYSLEEYKQVQMFQARIGIRDVIHEGGAENLEKPANDRPRVLVKQCKDYPLGPLDTIERYIVEPSYPQLIPDKEKKGHYVFKLIWHLRVAVVGPQREPYVPPSEEELEARALEVCEVLAPPPDLHSKTSDSSDSKRPLEGEVDEDSSEPPAKKAKA